MRISIISNGFEKHRELLEKCMKERVPVELDSSGMVINLKVKEDLGPKESFLIEKENDTWNIVGADEAGLYYGIGKFLHTAKWTEATFEPKQTSEVSAPAHDFRAVYTSVHFHNWYHEAPTEELERYLEDLLLWGHNTIISIVPLVCFNSCDEPAFFEAVEKNRAIFKMAKNLGMKVGIIINPNQGLKTTPREFAADPAMNIAVVQVERIFVHP